MLDKRELELTLIALQHYVDCDIDEAEREEMNELIKKLEKETKDEHEDSIPLF